MVFCGLFPIDADDYPALREALGEALAQRRVADWEPETSQALGFGFRCGFLGLLHMDIVRERLEREYDLELLATTPNVAYRVTDHRRGDPGREPGRAADPQPDRDASTSPSCAARSWSPEDVGAIMELCQERRGSFVTMEPIEQRQQIVYDLPLAEIVLDFYDQLKSRTQGLRLARLRPHRRLRESPLVKLDILLTGDPVDALSIIVHRDLAYARQAHRRAPAEDDSAAAVRGADPGGHRRPRSSPARRSRPSARTCSPSATAATSAASASCSSARRRARSG